MCVELSVEKARRHQALEVMFETCLNHEIVEVMVTPRYLYSVVRESGEPDRRGEGNEEVKGTDR